MLGLKSLVGILKIHPTHTCAHPGTPTHNCAHPYTLSHTRTHPCTSPHIPAHGLNLINHMKLHVNRPNTKKARKQESKKKEKRKEQESAEAFSGLKNLDIALHTFHK